MPEKLTEQEKLEKRALKPVNKTAFRALVHVANALFKKKYGVNFTYADDIKPYLGKSYVVVSNHASRIDYVFTAPAFWPDTFNFVVGYNEFFRSHLAAVLRIMQVVPKKNFVQQPYSIRQMIRIIRAGGRLIILPEGMSSISGANQPCALGSGHLLKHLGVPVLYTKIAGGYLTAPKYNLNDRPGRVDVTVGVLLTAEQVKAMTAEEIQAYLDEKLWHDDYEWNKSARVKFDGHGEMAKNLHQLLFWCPRCGGELCMESEGDTIRCRHCGNTAHVNEYYDLLPEPGSEFPATQRLWFVYAAFAYLVPVLALFLKRERPAQGGGNSYLLKSERPAQGEGRRAPLLSTFKKKEAYAPQRGSGRIEKRSRGRGNRYG